MNVTPAQKRILSIPPSHPPHRVEIHLPISSLFLVFSILGTILLKRPLILKIYPTTTVKQLRKLQGHKQNQRRSTSKIQEVWSKTKKLFLKMFWKVQVSKWELLRTLLQAWGGQESHRAIKNPLILLDFHGRKRLTTKILFVTLQRQPEGSSLANVVDLLPKFAKSMEFLSNSS